MSSPNEVPTKLQVRGLAFDVMGAVATELLLARLARRLKRGKAEPSGRHAHRFVGAILSEIAAEAAANAYWQRRRLRAHIDRRLAASALGAITGPAAHVPGQRGHSRHVVKEPQLH